MTKLRDLSLLQIELVSRLRGIRGIRDLARSVDMDAAAVSRKLNEVERILRVSLFTRSKKGIVVTARGEEVAAICQQILEQAAQIEHAPVESAWSRVPLMTIGSRAFLNAAIAESLVGLTGTSYRWRFVDSSPQELLRASLVGAIDIAIHLEDWSMPVAWQKEHVADLSWGLVARADHPLSDVASLSEVKKYPFIVASFLNQDRIQRAADIFPLKWSERILGHEAQTTIVMSSILRTTDHVAYLPLVSVARDLMSKNLKLIEVRKMERVSMPIFLSVHRDRVNNRALIGLKKSFEVFKALATELGCHTPVERKDSKHSRDLSGKKLSL